MWKRSASHRATPDSTSHVLNELDRELERRGHRFVRYADDANIYVRSPRAGMRVMRRVECFLNQRLKLTLNRDKSRVAGSWIRGWAGYFKLTQGKRALEILDGWVRHKLRCVIWRQWKQPSTRARNLMRLGLDEGRACTSAFNGRGPWWNSGASHMNQALPKKLWDQLGLVSILDTINRLSRIT